MGRLRRVAAIALMLAVAGLGAGCTHEGAAVPGPNDGASLDFTSKATVTIDDNGISPSSVRVEAGDAITVVNKGTRDHGLTSTSIDTGTMHPGESTIVFLTDSGRVDAHDPDAADRTVQIDVSTAAS